MVLDHEQGGAGADVVFLHAAIGDRRLWDGQWSWTTTRYRALRCDFRGFGETPLPLEPYSHAQDVIELLDATNVARAVLVAGSLGGRVALEVALARPGLVGALVLVSPGLLGYDWSSVVRAFGDAEDDALERGDIDAAVELNMRMWFDGQGRASSAVDATRRAAVAEMQRRALERQLAAGDAAVEKALVGDQRHRLAEIEVPVLVVVGEYDAPDFHTIGAVLAAELPNAEYRILPDTAHVPNYERPHGFDAVLAPALATFVAT